MTLSKFLSLFDGHLPICINDNHLECITRCDIFSVPVNLYHYHVVAFGVYDGELCIRINKGEFYVKRSLIRP